MIRPIDLQNAIIASQATPAIVRAEAGQRIDAQLAQAAFAAEVTRNEETVAPATEVLGNRVDAKADEGRERSSEEKPKKRARFECIVDDRLEPADELPHIIDLMA